MEQRALLAVALVTGCVTAAGAGGYLAVSQLAGPASSVPVAQAQPAAADANAGAVEGTESEILPAPMPEPTPPAPRPPAPQPAARVPERTAPAAPAPPPARATRPVAEPARPPAAAPAPAPLPVPAPRQEPAAPTYRPPSAPATRPTDTTNAPAATTPTRRAEPAEPEVWSSSRGGSVTMRDSGTPPRDDRGPDRGLPAATGGDSGPAAAVEPSAAPTPVRRLEDVTIPADAVIGVQLETTVSTQTARVEDPVRARVTRDVLSGGQVVVPAGSRLLGNVTLVDEGGKIRERSRLGVRFHTLVLANGTEVRLPTETIYRDGESPAGRSAAKIGGAAAGGAILGAILGGGKGAIIGAATGAGSGTAVAMAGERRPAELRSGQPVTVRVSDNVSTQVER